MIVLLLSVAAATCSADASPRAENDWHNEAVEGITLTAKGELEWRGKRVRWRDVDNLMRGWAEAHPERRFMLMRAPEAPCEDLKRVRELINRHFRCGSDRCIEVETPPEPR